MKKFALFILFAMSFHAARAQQTEVAVETPASPLETVAPAEPAATESTSSELPIAEEAVQPAAEPSTPKAPTFVVIVPERIDHDWYWILYSDRSQHIVQSAIEKSLIRAGVDVIDLSTAQSLPPTGGDLAILQTVNYAMMVGKKVDADYIVSGQATAVKSSEGTAYNVNVVRTQAEVTAKIIRTRDGKVLAVEDASVLEGGQSSQAAGQNALKKAGSQVGSKIAAEARKILAESKAAQ